MEDCLLFVAHIFAESSTFLLDNISPSINILEKNNKKIFNLHENYHFYFHLSENKSNVRPENRLFSFLNPLAWSIWISMVSTSFLAEEVFIHF